MRMRRKPWAKEMIESRTDCVIATPETMAGKWMADKPYTRLHVEIGAGKGDYWIAMAHMYPEEMWVAVEKDADCAAIALKKSLDQTTGNMKFIIGDARDLENWFGLQEIDCIHLNFSDPWPKKRHTKRRLTHDEFLLSYARVLKDDGRILMKTDNASLFEYSLVSFSRLDWVLEEASVDYRRDQHPEDAVTEYENNFMNLGQPIYRAVWQKRDRTE